MARMTDEEVSKMQQEVADLKLALAKSDLARTEAEEQARALSEFGRYTGDAEEQPTGKTTVIQVCSNPWERKEAKQKFKDVEVPTFFYTVNLPKGAWSLARNGFEYCHGQTYELDINTLRDLKSGVWGCWKHEYDIHGSNENEYRAPAPINLRGAHA